MIQSDRRGNVLPGAVLAFAGSMGAMGCVKTAFSLPVEGQGQVALAILLAALWASLALGLKKGGAIALLVPGALLWGYVWRQEAAARQLLQLIYRVSYVYHQAYGIGYLKLLDTPWDAGSFAYPLAIWGMVIAGAIAWGVVRGTSAALPLGAMLLPLVPCVVVTDTVPEARWLFLLLATAGVVVLTAQVRREDSAAGNRLTALVLLPVAVTLALVLGLNPRQGYVDQAQQLRQQVLEWFRQLPPAGNLAPQSPDLPAAAPERVEVSSLGNRRDSQAPVLTVTDDTGGVLYLRGQDYDLYDGRSWQATDHRAEHMAGWGVDMGYVTIQTQGLSRQVYLPYYPQPGWTLIGGRLENTQLQTSYTFRRMVPDGPAEGQSQAPYPEYLALPEQSRQAIQAFAREVAVGQTAAQQAVAIADYLRQKVSYNTSPSRMPEEEGDFALWFARQARQGYCVHFATAAAVLLRGAGIPARYVSGYMGLTQPGEPVTFTGSNAHAWAEYYDPELGTWQILEATPAAGLPSRQSQPEATDPPQTQPEQLQESQQPPTLPAQIPPTQQSQPEPPQPERPLPGWIPGLLVLILAGCAAEGQRQLRLAWQDGKRRRGDPNRRALTRWQQAQQLAKLLGQTPPEPVEALALKARFSQHTLTAQELLEMEAYLIQGKKELRKHPWYRQIVYRYWYAIF